MRAQQARLSWDPNSEPDVVGYYLLWGTASGTYIRSLFIEGRTTETVTAPCITPITFYVIRARNEAGLDSGNSNEVQVNCSGIPTGTRRPIAIGGVVVVVVVRS